MSDIAERVKKIVVEHLGVDPAKVTDSSSFIDDLNADSLDTVELVMAFEEEFSVKTNDIRKTEYADRYSLEEEIVRRNQSEGDIEDNFLEGMLEMENFKNTKAVERMVKQFNEAKRKIRTD